MVIIKNLITVDDFHDFIGAEGDEIRVAKLYAPWCQPCKALSETIKNLDKDKIGNTQFAEIDIDTDETDSIGMECGVRSVPVLIFYKNGFEQKRIVGAASADKIYDAINELS